MKDSATISRDKFLEMMERIENRPYTTPLRNIINQEIELFYGDAFVNRFLASCGELEYPDTLIIDIFSKIEDIHTLSENEKIDRYLKMLAMEFHSIMDEVSHYHYLSSDLDEISKTLTKDFGVFGHEWLFEQLRKRIV